MLSNVTSPGAGGGAGAGVAGGVGAGVVPVAPGLVQAQVMVLAQAVYTLAEQVQRQRSPSSRCPS